MATEATVPGHLPRKQLPTLTTLRFFAAAIVVVFHCGRDVVQGHWAGDFFLNGYEAVSFFFVLSGFILTYVYATEGKVSFPKRRFWVARITRVVPLYLLALLIALPPLIYSVFVAQTLLVSTFIGGIVTTPLFLQAWFPSLALIWNAPAWSLSVEALFYLAFPFLFTWAERFNRVSFLVIAVGLSIVTGIFRTTAAMSLDEGNQTLHNLLGYFPLFHLPQFITGLAVGRIFLKSTRLDSRLTEALLASILIAIGLIFWSRSLLPKWMFSDAVLVLLYAVAIYMAAVSRGPLTGVLSHPWLVLLGEASYGIYILHSPLHFYWRRALHYSGQNASTLSSFLLFVICLILLSIGAYYIVEKPGRAFLTRRLCNSIRNGIP